MADDEDLRNDEKLNVPTLLNRIIAILLSIYFLCFLVFESYHFTSRNFISAGIHEYLLFWVICQHLVYFVLALLASKSTESSSSFLPTIFTGLTFPLSQLIVILWITNSMCNECINSRDLYNILPQHMHGITHFLPFVTALFEMLFYYSGRSSISLKKIPSLVLLLAFLISYCLFVTSMALWYNGQWIYPVLRREQKIFMKFLFMLLFLVLAVACFAFSFKTMECVIPGEGRLVRVFSGRRRVRRVDRTELTTVKVTEPPDRNNNED